MKPSRSRSARSPAEPAAIVPAVRSRWSAGLVLMVVMAAVLAGAWWATGQMSRRAGAALLPPLPDLQALPDPVRAQVLEADAAARARPDRAADVGRLGIVYLASLDDTRADQALARAEVLDAADWQWTYYRALIAESRNRSTETIALLSEVVRRNPAWGLAWFRIGEAELKMGRLDAAARAYQRARDAGIPTPPGDSPAASRTPALHAYATTGLARVAIERGEAAEARALLAPLAAQAPPFGPAVRLLRQVADSGEGGRAYVPPADSLVDAVVNLSRHADLLLKHAALAARAGDRARREFLIRRALSFHPRDPNVLMEMAGLLQATGRSAEALDYLKQHEGIDPEDHHGLVEQGRCLIDLGRFVEAEQVLRRAVRVRDAAAEYNLGVALDRQDRWDEARRHYEQAIALDRFHARALNNLAVGLARRGDRAGARALHERAVAAAPDNVEVHTNLATALLLEGRSAEAIAALERALALDPASADAHNNLGVALGQMGRLSAAAAEFREALRLDPVHADARRNLDRLGFPQP